MCSGLTEAEHRVIKSQVRETLYPDQTRVQKQLQDALAELKGEQGLPALRRAIVERAKLPASEAKPKIEMPAPKRGEPDKPEAKPEAKPLPKTTIDALVRGAGGAL